MKSINLSNPAICSLLSPGKVFKFSNSFAVSLLGDWIFINLSLTLAGSPVENFASASWPCKELLNATEVSDLVIASPASEEADIPALLLNPPANEANSGNCSFKAPLIATLTALASSIFCFLSVNGLLNSFIARACS